MNLLIGSGASRPHFETLNNIEAAFTLIEKKRDSANADLARVLCAKRYTDAVAAPELEIGPVEGYQTGNQAKETLAGYARLITAIHTLVAMHESPVGSKLVNIFTTNYDTCNTPHAGALKGGAVIVFSAQRMLEKCYNQNAKNSGRYSIWSRTCCWASICGVPSHTMESLPATAPPRSRARLASSRLRHSKPAA